MKQNRSIILLIVFMLSIPMSAVGGSRSDQLIDYRGLKVNDRFNMPAKNQSQSIKETVAAIYETYSIVDIVEAADNHIEQTPFDASGLNEEKLEMIQQDFPELTLEEILENMVTIEQYYIDGLSLMVEEDLQNNFQPSLDCEDDVLNRICVDVCCVLDEAGYYGDLLAYIAIYKSAIAEEIAAAGYPESQTFDNRIDAHRHVLFSSLLAKNYFTLQASKVIRVNFAEAIGNAIETCGSNNPDSKAMDLHNNFVGRANFSSRTTYKKFLGVTYGLNIPSTSEFNEFTFQSVANGVYIPAPDRAIKVQNTDPYKVVYFRQPIAGPGQICTNMIGTFALDDLALNQNVIWRVSSNRLRIDSYNNAFVVVSPNSIGTNEWVEAEVSTTKGVFKLRKSVYVGRKSQTGRLIGPSSIYTNDIVTYYSPFVLGSGQTVRWDIVTLDGPIIDQVSSVLDCPLTVMSELGTDQITFRAPSCVGQYKITCTISDPCGRRVATLYVTVEQGSGGSTGGTGGTGGDGPIETEDCPVTFRFSDHVNVFQVKGEEQVRLPEPDDCPFSPFSAVTDMNSVTITDYWGEVVYRHRQASSVFDLTWVKFVPGTYIVTTSNVKGQYQQETLIID